MVAHEITHYLKWSRQGKNGVMAHYLKWSRQGKNGVMAHYLKWSRQGKNGVMTLKIVMAKAYDLIEWKFLEDIMLKLGFHDVGVSLLEKCFIKIKS